MSFIVDQMFSLKSSSSSRRSSRRSSSSTGKLFLLLRLALPLWAPPPCPLALPLVLSLQYSHQPRHVYWRVHMAVACEVGRDLKTRNRKHSTHTLSLCLSLSLALSPSTVLTLLYINNWLGLNADSVVHPGTQITCQNRTKPLCHYYDVDSSHSSRLKTSLHMLLSNPSPSPNFFNCKMKTTSWLFCSAAISKLGVFSLSSWLCICAPCDCTSCLRFVPTGQRNAWSPWCLCELKCWLTNPWEHCKHTTL